MKKKTNKCVFFSSLILSLYLLHWLLKCCDIITFITKHQSTPVGSLQTGHEVVVSPNRDRHQSTNRVSNDFFFVIFVSFFFLKNTIVWKLSIVYIFTFDLYICTNMLRYKKIIRKIKMYKQNSNFALKK